MKKNILTVLLTMVLTVSCVLFAANHLAEPKAVEWTNDKTIQEVFNAADLNYTRETVIYLTSTALTAAHEKNKFDFTLTRTTYFIENGLYMTNADRSVNSGYLSYAKDQTKMYHYTIDNYAKDGEAIANVKYSAANDVDEFFTNYHYFNVKAEDSAYTSLFSNTAKNTWESTDSTVISDFLAFCASCYTNTEAWDVDGNSETPDKVMEFTKAVVTVQMSGSDVESYTFALYTSDTVAVGSDGLFAVAKIVASTINNTTISAIASTIAE